MIRLTVLNRLNTFYLCNITSQLYVNKTLCRYYLIREGGDKGQERHACGGICNIDLAVLSLHFYPTPS